MTYQRVILPTTEVLELIDPADPDSIYLHPNASGLYTAQWINPLPMLDQLIMETADCVEIAPSGWHDGLDGWTVLDFFILEDIDDSHYSKVK